MADPDDAPDGSDDDASCEEGDAALSSSLWTGGRSRAWTAHLLGCARCRARAARADAARAATIPLDDAARALGIDPGTITPVDPADLRAWQHPPAAPPARRLAAVPLHDMECDYCQARRDQPCDPRFVHPPPPDGRDGG